MFLIVFAMKFNRVTNAINCCHNNREKLILVNWIPHSI